MRATGLVSLLLLVCAAAAQDLPPDVLLLARLKSQIREELSRTPNYTCLETVSRYRNESGSRSGQNVTLKPLDTVRLEIVYTDHHEWYGSPGDRNLSSDRPAAFIGVGMIGSGGFAATLNNIVQGGVFTPRGDQVVDGRSAVRFDFTLSRFLRPLTISIPGGSGTVGEKGSLWADRQTLQLLRLESHADDIPPSLPLDEASTTVNYAPVKIGESSVLLAQHAGMHTLDSSGVDSYNRLEFTHCRAYSAESEIRFDPEPSPDLKATTPPGAPDTASRTIPALLAVTVRLVTPVSDQDTVGSLIEGKVAGSVMHKGKLLIPDGAVVHGRIRRLDRYQGGGSFIVGLEFTEVEVPGGGPWQFYADLLAMDKDPRIRATLSERVILPNWNGFSTRETTVTLRELPGVATFFVTGNSFTVPAGFGTTWRTRGPLR